MLEAIFKSFRHFYNYFFLPHTIINFEIKCLNVNYLFKQFFYLSLISKKIYFQNKQFHSLFFNC